MFTFRKGILSFVTVLVIVFVLSVNVLEVSANYTGYIKGTNVNVRSKPTTSSDVLGSISNKKVSILRNSGDWYNISSGDVKGWVRFDYVTDIKQLPQSENSSDDSSKSTIVKTQDAVIKGTNVNIRTKPTLTSQILTSVSDKQVKVVSSSGDWYRVSFDKTIGWVKNDFVSLSTPALSSRTLSASSTEKTAENSSSKKPGKIDGTDVNIRSKPTTSAAIVSTLSNKDVDIVGQSGEWYKISSGKITGWVYGSFVKVASNSASAVKSASSENTTSEKIPAKIDGTDVNIRSKPTTNANIITSLTNKDVHILGQSGKWYKISSGGTTGWVYGSYVNVSSTYAGKIPSINSEASSAAATAVTLRNRMVLYSRNFLGVRYRYGGSSPSGFDCSGFTSYVFKKFGINLERVSTAQAKQGKYVPKAKLQPGDLVCFDTNGGKTKKVNHVGIYIGNGKFIHASSSSNGRVVKISSLSEGFYNNAYVTGRTFVK